VHSAVAPTEGNAMPQPGDITMCVRCGFLMSFGRGLVLRRLSLRKLQEAMESPDVVLALKAHASVVGDPEKPN